MADLRNEWAKAIESCSRHCKMFGFELTNIEDGEPEYHDIKADFEGNRLSWGEYSVEYDDTFDMDANLENLYGVILESGKYE